MTQQQFLTQQQKPRKYDPQLQPFKYSTHTTTHSFPRQDSSNAVATKTTQNTTTHLQFQTVTPTRQTTLRTTLITPAQNPFGSNPPPVLRC